ncbi:MAG: cellulase family glycosylhydrolase [bacterium]|nr:cellulase family glycosylhydrolase [bacterium]
MTKKRMAQIDAMLSRSVAQRAALQAAMAAKESGTQEGIEPRDYHVSGGAGKIAQMQMHSGKKHVSHRPDYTARRRKRRGFFSSRGNVITVAMIVLVIAMALFLSNGCGSEKDGGASGTTAGGSPAAGSTADRSEGNSVDAAGGEASGEQNDEDGGNMQTDGEGSGEAQTDGESTGEAQTGGGEDADTELTCEIPEVAIPPYELPDNEALAFVHDMKIGWSLGNTLDAYSDGGYTNELDSETCWVSVATTKEMIDDIYEAGFRTMRVPVTWHGHFTDEDFTISGVWLDRVQEIVDYGIDNGMYIILNIHHDTREDCYFPDTEHLEQSTKYISAVWSQLSARFADYDEHLIFEGMNEPRLVGHANEWWIDNHSEDCMDAIACINTLNQVFVDTVRAGGGNNGSRYLMVPGYDASPEGALHSDFVLPSDPGGAENRLMVSVHAYTPYNFALQSPGDAGSRSEFDAGSSASTRDIDSFMDRLYDRFISQGIPVVIGEFGARDKDQNTQDRVDYAAYYIAAARARGITCLWWDNNAFSGNGENFGLYYRRGGYFIYPDIVAALMKYADSFE